ncbi:MAG: ABC transporter permease, partial [Chryseolinea sp.]
DLMELYDERINEFGKRKADVRFIIDVLLLFRPSIIKPPEGYKNVNRYTMYKSYFTIGWRNLLRNKGYSFINIGGLATGMAIAILISLWIWDEVSYDKNHQNYNQLAQVMQHQTVDGNTGSQVAIPRPLENALRNMYGNDFSYLSMASWAGEHILSSGEQKISQTGNYVQADFPEMITLKMIAGTRNGLKDPASILISTSTAKALFGTTDPMNQFVRIDNTLDVKVTGIYEDMPPNSSFNELQFISSWELYAESESWMKRSLEQWDNNSFQLFVQVAPGTTINAVSEKIKTVRADITKDVTFKPEVYLHPMSDWHLRSQWKNGINIGGRIQTVWLFGIVGIFVLLLACINFMNLSTARSEKRAKEVGIRMTIGSLRSQLINQFLSESFLVVLLAFTFAVGLVTLSLPLFNDLADKEIILTWSNPYFWLLSLLFILITSLLAGSYPALYLSSFRPVKVLKGSFKTGRLTSLPRKVLVVVQFTVSVTLVIGTIIVYEQIQFSKNRPMGYNSKGLVMIQMKSPDFYGKYDVLRTELKNSGAVVEMSESSSPLTGVWQNSGGFNWPGKDSRIQSADFGTIRITPEYGTTVDWKIKEGRDISREFVTDSTAILLNEAAVEFMNVKDPLGMEITWGDTKFHVIGVVQNLIMESPYKPIRPNIYLQDIQRANWIFLKLNPEKSASESLATIGSVFKKHIPSAPFDYKFVDEEYSRKFGDEERIGKLAYVFATLATFISCLGLIGLASFVAEQHTKEIGIRKVLGASIAQLWKLLSGNFVILVLISSAIAIPISYYFMNNWLLNYQYHTEISWTTFIVTVLGALMITLCTVSFQAIKAAMTNPVKSLRSE